MFDLAITRRHLLQSGAFAAIAPSLGIAAGVPAAGPASAQSQGEPVWRHALSLFGDVKYAADFKRFDYVSPDAPKGGVARQILIGTFDNFNLAVAGVKGSLASAVALINESLMTPSLDEVSTEYGALAESVSHPEDFSFVIYRLRAQAKWHDGKPVTPEDVIFSLDAFKKYHPQYSAYYRHVVKAEKAGERDIKFTFDAPGNRELPRFDGRARGVQGRSGGLAHRKQREKLGHGLRFSGRHRKTRTAGRIPKSQLRHHAGVCIEHPPRQVQGSAGAPRAEFRVRFRGDEQADFLQSV